MKTIKFKPAFISIIAVILLVSLINGCKKIDKLKTNEVLNNNIEEAVRNSVKKQMELQGGIPQVTLINQRIPAVLVDMQGNAISKEKLASMRLSSTCAGDVPDFVDLKQYIRIYNCSSTTSSTIQFEYQVSWNNTVVKVSPYNANNKTRGRVRIIYQPLNQTWQDKTTFDVSIKDLGVDPGNPDNNIYAVKFTCPDLITDYLANDNFIIRLGATFVSDSSTLDQHALAPADPAGYGISPGDATQPCNRVDKVYFQPPGIIASNVIGVVGCNIFGNSCYSSFFVVPSLSETQYSLDGGATFQSFINYTATSPSGMPINNSRFIREFDIAKSSPISSGTYNLVIRYKNWRYNNSSYQWQIPTSTNACQTYSNTLGNSYVYEYYFGTVIP
ncbi:MAG: hypothetical protein HYX40_08040 [Sphingobacteriales bacterium]|nr:hypothetical protein [Sphingobacteriales bacterium]